MIGLKTKRKTDSSPLIYVLICLLEPWPWGPRRKTNREIGSHPPPNGGQREMWCSPASYSCRINRGENFLIYCVLEITRNTYEVSF